MATKYMFVAVDPFKMDIRHLELIVDDKSSSLVYYKNINNGDVYYAGTSCWNTREEAEADTRAKIQRDIYHMIQFINNREKEIATKQATIAKHKKRINRLIKVLDPTATVPYV